MGWSRCRSLVLKEVFQTHGMWSKLIVIGLDGSRSLDRESLDACSQRHKHDDWDFPPFFCLCGWSSQWQRNKEIRTSRLELYSEGYLHELYYDNLVKCGFGAIRQEVRFRHTVRPVFVHSQTDKKKPLYHFQSYFMHNSVNEIWWDEEMVSSFPEH